MTSEDIVDCITFCEGLPGFPDCHRFVLKPLKEGFYDPLKVLISLDYPDLAFILYPHTDEDAILIPDKKNVLKEQVSGPASIYSIVTIQEPNGHFFLTTNLGAPILVNEDTQQAQQIILPNDPDAINFPLEELSLCLRQKRSERNT
jgi:flagellar assembly factor FliW